MNCIINQHFLGGKQNNVLLSESQINTKRVSFLSMSQSQCVKLNIFLFDAHVHMLILDELSLLGIDIKSGYFLFRITIK